MTAGHEPVGRRTGEPPSVLLARHLAQRRHLYAKAMSQGDSRTALQVEVDEAKLQQLYQPEKGTGILETVLALLPPDLAAEIRTALARMLSTPGASSPAGQPPQSPDRTAEATLLDQIRQDPSRILTAAGMVPDRYQLELLRSPSRQTLLTASDLLKTLY